MSQLAMYSKHTGMFIMYVDVPIVDDEDVATTDIPVPDDGLNHAFEDGKWLSFDEDAWRKRQAKFANPEFGNGDEDDEDDEDDDMGVIAYNMAMMLAKKVNTLEKQLQEKEEGLEHGKAKD